MATDQHPKHSIDDAATDPTRSVKRRAYARPTIESSDAFQSVVAGCCGPPADHEGPNGGTS